MTPNRDQVRRAPKVVLHDHLDGGLRPETVVDLAGDTGKADLPTRDPDELAAWFDQGRSPGDLEAYLSAFAHTVGVMQTEAALTRVAAECVEDLADDGVVYAEVRFAPELHTAGGLTAERVVEAVLAGLEPAAAHRGIDVRLLLCAMRTGDRSGEIADLVGRFRGTAVVGFDIAGPEAGHPPGRHRDAFDRVRAATSHVTAHAGEGAGLASIHEAVTACGAERLGHGVRIVDDLRVHDDGTVELGDLAHYVRDRRIPLELCPTSNVHTGAVASVAEHPVERLRRLGFRVTVNTDNRLMSRVTLTDELLALVDAFGYGAEELEELTVNAAKSAFCRFDDRVRLIEDVIVPGYRTLATEAGVGSGTTRS